MGSLKNHKVKSITIHPETADIHDNTFEKTNAAKIIKENPIISNGIALS